MNKIPRRGFLSLAAAAGIGGLRFGPGWSPMDDVLGPREKAGLLGRQFPNTQIDRKSLVSRHNPVLRSVDLSSPLQIRNGEFAFTADITGLQTFGSDYERGMPLGTMSQWGWHSFPNSGGYKLEDILIAYDSHGRRVTYPADVDTLTGSSKQEGQWLEANPQRIHLGCIGLVLRKADGGSAHISDIVSPRQELDLWACCLKSQFHFEGQPVIVKTLCHPELDLIAFRVESPHIASKRIGISLAFPYASASFDTAYDWNSPTKHQTKLLAVVVPPGLLNERLLLDCGEVGVVAEAWVNGQSVGSRAWEPFAFDITNHVRAGSNRIKVRISNTEANARAVGTSRYILENIDLDGWHGPACLVPYVDRELQLARQGKG